MKGITIHQPWAWAIAAGHKRIENRTWSVSYRGPIAIHAGKSKSSIVIASEFCLDRGIEPPSREDLVFGKIIAVARLIDVVDYAPAHSLWEDANNVQSDPWAFGPKCWILDDIQPLTEPVEYKGNTTLWKVCDEAIAAIAEQIGL